MDGPWASYAPTWFSIDIMFVVTWKEIQRSDLRTSNEFVACHAFVCRGRPIVCVAEVIDELRRVIDGPASYTSLRASRRTPTKRTQSPMRKTGEYTANADELGYGPPTDGIYNEDGQSFVRIGGINEDIQSRTENASRRQQPTRRRQRCGDENEDGRGKIPPQALPRI